MWLMDHTTTKNAKKNISQFSRAPKMVPKSSAAFQNQTPFEAYNRIRGFITNLCAY